MCLKLERLENVREAGSGRKQAQCPACAADGGDGKGEHLWIYPDGRFGCCVHPKDKEHRRRIFALAGGRRAPQPMRVRVAGAGTTTAAAVRIGDALKAGLGTLGTGGTERMAEGQGLGTLGTPGDGSDSTAQNVGTPGTPEIESVSGGEISGTLGTLDGESVESGSSAAECLELDFGTLGTPFFKPSAHAREDMHACSVTHACMESARCVPSVLSREMAETTPKAAETAGGTGQPAVQGGERLPYLAADGTLVIPLDAPARYRWWQGGQSVAQTRAEVRARAQIVGRKETHGIGI